MHKRKHTKDFVFNFYLLYFSAHIPLDLDIIIVKLKSNSSSVSLKLIKTFENIIFNKVSISSYHFLFISLLKELCTISLCYSSLVFPFQPSFFLARFIYVSVLLMLFFNKIFQSS